MTNQEKAFLVFFTFPLSQYSFFLFVIIGVYTAPELYRDEIFDKSVDAFSFAVILYEVYIF